MSEERSTPLERCLDMLGDVPGKDLEQRLTHYIGSYMALQIERDKLRNQLVQARTLLRLTFDIARRNENCTWFYDVQKFLTDERGQ